MFSPDNAPKGCGSIQAEVYFSDKYKPLTGAPEDWIEPVIRDLRRMGLVREEDQVVFRNARLLRYANIIFDLERADALKTVHGYLDDVGIAYCGRYGDWAICGRMKASRAESRLPKRRYRRWQHTPPSWHCVRWPARVRLWTTPCFDRRQDS